MRIYLAGKYDDITNYNHFKQIIDESGHIITYDWTIRAEQFKNKKKTSKDLQIDAELDINGVMEADITIAIMNDPTYVYRGTLTEIGASIARDILRKKQGTIIVSSNENIYAATCCFYYHPGIIRVSTIEEALVFIKKNI